MRDRAIEREETEETEERDFLIKSSAFICDFGERSVEPFICFHRSTERSRRSLRSKNLI